MLLKIMLPQRFSGKEFACQCRRLRFNPQVRKIRWRRNWQPTPVFLLGKSHGQRSLAGYSPQGHIESDMTEVTQNTYYHYGLPRWFTGGKKKKIHLPSRRFRFYPWVGKCPVEGNGNPLWYYCLENLMDKGAWQAIGLQRVSHNLATKQQ